MPVQNLMEGEIDGISPDTRYFTTPDGEIPLLNSEQPDRVRGNKYWFLNWKLSRPENAEERRRVQERHGIMSKPNPVTFEFIGASSDVL